MLYSWMCRGFSVGAEYLQHCFNFGEWYDEDCEENNNDVRLLCGILSPTLLKAQ